MRTSPSNPSQGERCIVYYPEKTVFLRDFNAITLVVNDDVKNMQITFEVHYNGLTKTFIVNVDSNTATVDLSYFLQQLGAGITIDYVSVSGSYILHLSNTSQNISTLLTDSFTTQNGYSLPNRQHFSETDIYAPPLSVYRADNHPNAEKVELEFATNQVSIINGERHEAGETFDLSAPDEDCKIDVQVDVVGGFEAWRRADAGWAYGCSYFWSNHIFLDINGPVGTMIKTQILENEPYVNPELISFASRLQETDGLTINKFVIGAFFSPDPRQIGRYTIWAFSYIGENKNEWQFIRPSKTLYILTDEYDDFLINDYGDPKGYKQVTYKILDSRFSELQSCDFIFYNHNMYFDGSPTAYGSLFVGLNEPIRALPAPSGSPLLPVILDRLGITSNCWQYDESYKPYDYTLSDGQKTYAVKTLYYGRSLVPAVVLDRHQALKDIIQDRYNTPTIPVIAVSNIATIHQQGLPADNQQQPLIPVAFTYQPRTGLVIPNIIIYTLHSIFRFFRNYNWRIITTISTSPIFSTKLFDNAISANSATLGVSFLNVSYMGVTIPMWYGDLNLLDNKAFDGKRIADDQREMRIEVPAENVYMFAIPSNQTKFLSSAIHLRTVLHLVDEVTGEEENVNVWFDFQHNVYTDEQHNDEQHNSFYLQVQNQNLSLLSITEPQTLGFYADDEGEHFTGEVTSSAFSEPLKVDITYINDNTQNATYFIFPYNCVIPTTLTNDNILQKYALIPIVVSNVGKGMSPDGDDLGASIIVNEANISPFNVGRSTVIDGQVYQNPPETDGWYCLSSVIEYTYPIQPLNPVYLATTGNYHTYRDYFNDLYNGIEMLYYLPSTWKNTNRPLLTYEGDNSTVVPSPCQDAPSTVINFTEGQVASYRIIIYSLCDTDQIFWLKYENMDGFVRWLPFEIKRRVYTTEMGDFKYVTPTQSSINAYPLQAPLSLQEKIVCFIDDVPRGCYIEDILYSPYLEGWNWDGSVHFNCVLEENEITRDSSQELEDFVLTFIKKK